MAGALVMVVLLVIVLPVAILFGGAFVAGLLGHLVKREVDGQYEGSELLEISESNPYDNLQ